MFIFEYPFSLFIPCRLTYIAPFLEMIDECLALGKIRLKLDLTVERYLAGVPELGLNRGKQTHNPLRQGGGLKILWRRPPWVQIPPPAPT
jgi:hypothetical protein